MRHLKILGVALVAMFALGITATSAFALPDISIALGGAYPIHLQFGDNGKTKSLLETITGAALHGEGLLLLLLTKELSSLGTYEALFLNVIGPLPKTTNCNTEGDKKGEVLTTGTFHVVYIKLTPLTLGIAFLTAPVTIKCEKTTTKVEGCALSTLEAAEGELTKVSGELKGEKGKNNLTKYFNSEGKEVECKLLSNFGTGNQQSDEVVAEPIPLEVLEGKMFEITGR